MSCPQLIHAVPTLHNVLNYQGNIKDLLNPIEFRLTYDLSASEQVVPVMNEGDPLPDINTYPILNQAMAKTLFSVSI